MRYRACPKLPDLSLSILGFGGDACLECGECEPKCPQEIPIMERLKEAHAHLTG